MRRNLGMWMSVTVLLAWSAPLRAWHEMGHQLSTRAAVLALEESLPPFFVGGVETIAHVSLDADVVRLHAVPQLRAAQAPEHFIDLEYLQGRPLPKTRPEFGELCRALGHKPEKVGTVPYSVTEATQRLMVAFAEHRRWPENPHIQQKCLVYAGLLCHYAADLCQPLHTTLHFDGRVDPEGKTRRRGIHNKMDDLPRHLDLDVPTLARRLRVRQLEELFPAVVAEMKASHALVDRVYELEPLLPAGPGRERVALAAPLRELAEERMEASARFIAELMRLAWEQSEALKLPPWLQREGEPATQPAE